MEETSVKRALLLALALGWAIPAQAAVRTDTIEYHDGETALEGFLAYDDASQIQRPGVLVVHEWKGLNDYAKKRAEQLAGLGYIALAVDMYGKGVRAQSHDEAAKLSGVYKNDRQLMRRRILAGYDELKRHPLTDPARIAAIGYCFGGASVLELARSGADVVGVVSFHGSLSNPNPADARNIKGKVLILHGADDTFISPEEVEAFKQEMAASGADYKFIAYPGAVHSFTVPSAGNDPSTGMAYNAQADQQSWEAMREFFSQLFQESELKHIGKAPHAGSPSTAEKAEWRTTGLSPSG